MNETPGATRSSPLLEVRHLSKWFGGTCALDGVSFEVRAGEVHALLGENGAGKSTLMNVLAGLLAPDAGEIRFAGRPVRLTSPHAALRLGISMIHQELLPVPDLSVAENLYLGCEPSGWCPGWVDRRTMDRAATARLTQLGVRLDPRRRMADLSTAEMQSVEIARALVHQAQVVIMDEPTSAISDREAEALFAVIHDLRGRGVGVIYISHKLEEVFRLANRVTVLRDGRHVATRDLSEVEPPALIRMMVGRELLASEPRPTAARGEVALAVEGLTRAGRFEGIGLEVRRGEVLGLAGLMGAGRSEVLHALYGLAPADRGTLRVHGQPVRIRCPADALRLGIALVSEDRQRLGLIPRRSVVENLTLASLARCSVGPFISAAAERRWALDLIRTFAIKTPKPEAAVDDLSGGNQQKVLLARALASDPEILLLDEPTRGIDVGAKAEVHRWIRRLAAGGKAIVLVSSELPELLALSDRVLVLCEGRITATFDARDVRPEEILSHAMPGAPS